MKFIPFLMLTACLACAQTKNSTDEEISLDSDTKTRNPMDKEINLDSDSKRASYSLGVLMADDFKKRGNDSLDVDALFKGFYDQYITGKPKMTPEQCMQTFQDYMNKANDKKFASIRKASQDFLTANKTKEGVKTTASGLQYKVIKSGTGKAPSATSQVTVHYSGKLVDGTEFDSSYKRGEPATFPLNGVIPGWTEGLQLMKEGDKWTLYIPYHLGYGERGAGGDIPPYSTLIFEVELIKVN